MKDIFVHPPGEATKRALAAISGPVAVDTFAGRIHVEWDPQAAVTPLGQLPFFTEFLNVSGLFDPWVQECPFAWTSPNAPKRRDVLGTVTDHPNQTSSAFTGLNSNSPLWQRVACRNFDFVSGNEDGRRASQNGGAGRPSSISISKAVTILPMMA
jgi:hypothetical protein